MKKLWMVLLVLLGVPSLVAAQPCYSTQGSQEYCNALTNGVRFGFPRYATAALPTCNTSNKGAAAFNTTSGTVQVCSGTSWGDVGPAGSGITSLNSLIAGSQDFAQPAAGLTITSSVSTHTFALANDLAALEGLATTGLAARTAASTWTTRTITGTANEITVTNGDGVTGAPTLSLPAALTFTGKTVTGGTYKADLYSSPADTDIDMTASTPTTADDPVAGTNVGIVASDAVAGAVNAGAEVGGAVTISGGNAARLTSGDAAGGAVNLTSGAGIGNGNGGAINITAGAGAGSGVAGKVAITGSVLEIPTAAAPTVDAFGEIAGDNNLWGASRGAPIFYDGTASTALVNVLVSDTPANGECPKWNTGGTITWEACASGGISGLTTGTIPKAASATTLDDSRLIQSGNDVTAAVGTGTAAAKIGGWLYTNATSTAGSVSDGSTHTFGSGIGDYTLPANTLSASGKGVRITGAVQFTTGATLNLYLMFGSSQIGHISAVNKTSAVLLDCVLLRSSGASAQVSSCKLLRNESGYPVGLNEGAINADSSWVINETTEDATSTIAIQLLYESATDASKVVYKFMTVEAIQ